MSIPFLTALQFLTTFPVKLPRLASPDEMGRSLLFYPLIGLLLGIFLVMALYVLPTGTPLISAALLLIIWVVATGGLHLDGLGDSADAWLAGIGDKQRTLAIMKDPTCGPIAVITLVCLLLLKFTLLYTVVTQQNWSALLWACVLARLAMPLLFLTTPYVRERGLGAQMHQNLPAQLTRRLLAVTSLIAVFSIGLLPLLGTLLIFLLLRYFMQQRLDGFTGDTAGAMLEMLEVSLLLFILL